MMPLLRRRPELLALPVPGSEHRVFARTGTSDLAAFRHVFEGGYALELPIEPRVIFDLGANVGYTSVYFARRWPGARVLAVEPVPANAALLRRNVAAFSQVEVVERAIWPSSGWLGIDDVGKGYWGMRVRRGGRGRRVRAVTVSQLFTRAGADWADLVKIDIEGSELELFSEETEWLSHVGALVVELHDRFRPGCRDAVERAVARSGAAFHEMKYGADVLLVREDQGHRARGARRSTSHTS
jgi:FkbM family methyltransferase